MFIKRAKSRPSLRARETEDDGVSTGSPLKNVVSADNAGQATTGGSTVQAEDEEEYSGGSVMERKKAKNKEKKSNKGSRLSFGGPSEGGEEGGDGESSVPFKPKKSLLSQNIKLPSTPTSGSGSSLGNYGNASQTHSVAASTSSIYSKEYLSQLKANTPSRASKTTDDNAMDDDSQPSSTGMSSLPMNDRYAEIRQEDKSAGIPDEIAINAARAKRQARVEGSKRGIPMGEEDFISLGGGGSGQVMAYDAGEKGPHPESRLMREEDEGDEGDEGMDDYTGVNEKLYLGKQANKNAARRLKGEIGELIDDREAEDEDDEETREWEEAQVRRGGNWEPERMITEPKEVAISAPIPRVRPVPTIASAATRIAQALAQAEAVQAQAERNLEVTASDLAILEEQEKELRKEVERVEGKREWVEEFRGWVEMLAQFLEEKVPKLNEIEADGLHHLKERGEMVNKRRKLDDEDDLALFLGTPRPTLDAVDDMGRSREVEAGPSSAVRKARRSERQSRRSKRQARAGKQEEEGYSTDSSLAQGDEEDYESAQKDLRRRVRGLLDDVKAEDFRDPNKGLIVKFSDWREKYNEDYVGAFGGLSMVQAWEFYARSEMVGWDPLRSNTTIDSFDWFHSLHDYSRPRAKASNGVNGDEDDDMDMDDEPPLGPDGDLVIEMTTKTVLPILTKQFESGSYDPYSTRQTRKAIDLIEVISDLTGQSSQKYTSLLRAILSVFNTTIVDLANSIAQSMSPGAMRPPEFDPESRVALSRFVRKRAGLIKNALLWRRIAPVEVKEIINRIVGEVIRPILERQWDGGGSDLAQEILRVGGNELRPDLIAFLRDGPVRRAW